MSKKNEQFTFGGPVVWRPTPDYIENANLTRFMRLHGIQDFAALLHRSTQDVSLVHRRRAQIPGYPLPTALHPGGRPVARHRLAALVRGRQLNIVHNCLDKYIGAPGEDQIALIWEGEEGQTQKLTYGQLYRQVNQAANALRSLGLGKGDASACSCR